MSDLILLLYLGITSFTILLGYRVYHRWINHITIYGVVWGTQIVLFQLQLVAYPPFSVETVCYIFGAWAIFLVASLTFRNFYSSDQAGARNKKKGNGRVLTLVLILVTAIGAIGTAQHWLVLLHLFGSIKSVIINGNLVYSFTRMESGIPGMWPYVDSVSLAADFLGGYFAGSHRRPIILGIFPIFVEFVGGITGFGRARLVMGAILWGCAFFLPHSERHVAGLKILLKRASMVFAVVFIFVFGMEFIRSFRGVNESFAGETTALSRIKGVGIITPSIYMYLSSDVAVLNKFLSLEFSGEGEHRPIGGYTFAPFYRLFSKTGIAPYVSQYQPFYRVPVSTNTGTYLRELYEDWGIAGALVAVYIIGALCSVMFEIFRRTRSLASLAVLAHLYVLVFFSFAVMATGLTYWLISFVVSTAAGLVVDKLGSGELSYLGLYGGKAPEEPNTGGSQ